MSKIDKETKDLPVPIFMPRFSDPFAIGTPLENMAGGMAVDIFRKLEEADLKARGGTPVEVHYPFSGVLLRFTHFIHH